MEEISADCIVFWMRQIFELLVVGNRSKNFGFFDPRLLTTYDGEEMATTRLKDRLMVASENELLFVPWNLKNHWMLCLVDTQKKEIYFMDSISKPIRPIMKRILSQAMKAAYETKRTNQKISPKWVTVKSPKQPGDVECGYFISHYIKDVVNADNPLQFLKGEFSELKTYSPSQIDKFRNEWAAELLKFV
ncbi:hypothetical protein UlMin_019227 [Ulmus minor]